MKRYRTGSRASSSTRSASRRGTPMARDRAHRLPGSGRTAEFPVVTDAASLAWIVNLGCIELHTWHARVTDVERPDYLLIDLDPSEGNPWELVPRIALVVKEVLDELELPSFPKTSARPASTSSRRSDRSCVSPRCGASPGARAGGRAADRRPGRGDDDVEGRRPQRRLRGLRPERARPHDRLGLLDPPDAGCAASAPLRWEEVPARSGAFTLETMRDRVAEVGDLTAGMWRRKVSLRRGSAAGARAPGTADARRARWPTRRTSSTLCFVTHASKTDMRTIKIGLVPWVALSG